MGVMKIISCVCAAALLPLASVAPGYPAENPDRGSATDLTPKYGPGRIRVLVFDFTANVDTDAPRRAAGLIRSDLAGDRNFAVLDIDEINRLIVSGKLSVRGLTAGRKAAAYAGWKLRAHKVVIGGVTEEKGTFVVDAAVIDSATERVEFSKRYRGGEENPREKYAIIAREISDSLLGKAMPLPDNREETAPGTDESPAQDNRVTAGIGVSGGLLMAQGLPGDYLKNSYIATLHVTVKHSAFPLLGLDLSAGYSRLEAKNIREGEASLIFAPLLLTARARLPFTGGAWIPGITLFAGGGATYLSLQKSQYGEDISTAAFVPTASGGAGLSFFPFNGMFLEMEGSYNYLFESMRVNYIYAGIRAGAFF